MRNPAALSFLLLVASAIPVAGAVEPVTSVPTLDISRYAGHWHEIARLPAPFQDKCASDITAAYTLREDGLLGVRNACRTAEGRELVADGVARRVNGHPARLQVRFAPDWLARVPLVWADHWVIDLDPGYTWAVVGDPGRDYLWVLSRDPVMDTTLLEQIKERAQGMGFQLDPLIVSGSLR